MPVLQETPVIIVSINHRLLDNVSVFVRFYLKLALKEMIYTQVRLVQMQTNSNLKINNSYCPGALFFLIAKAHLKKNKHCMFRLF